MEQSTQSPSATQEPSQSPQSPARIGSSELQRRLERALAIAGNTHTLADIKDALDRREMQAWVKGDSFAITSVHQAPRKKILNVFLAVGELEDVLSLEPQIEDFARSEGCDFIEAIARPGWRRSAARRGWKSKQEIYRKELT